MLLWFFWFESFFQFFKLLPFPESLFVFEFLCSYHVDIAGRAISLGTDRWSVTVCVFTDQGFRGRRSRIRELPLVLSLARHVPFSFDRTNGWQSPFGTWGPGLYHSGVSRLHIHYKRYYTRVWYCSAGVRTLEYFFGQFRLRPLTLVNDFWPSTHRWRLSIQNYFKTQSSVQFVEGSTVYLTKLYQIRSQMLSWGGTSYTSVLCLP